MDVRRAINRLCNFLKCNAFYLIAISVWFSYDSGIHVRCARTYILHTKRMLHQNSCKNTWMPLCGERFGRFFFLLRFVRSIAAMHLRMGLGRGPCHSNKLHAPSCGVRRASTASTTKKCICAFNLLSRFIIEWRMSLPSRRRRFRCDQPLRFMKFIILHKMNVCARSGR